jgi:hypothetical protein
MAAVQRQSGGRKPRDVQLADLNGDNYPDIITANKRDKRIGVLMNRGNGNFRPPRWYDGSAPLLSLAATDNMGNELDFNLDGYPDVVASTSVGNYINVFLGKGNGRFKFQNQARFENRSVQAVAAGDVNSDGKADLVLAHNRGDFITVLLGNGNGTFADPVEFEIGDLKRRDPAALALGDLNNDGGIDIAVANIGSESISILLKNLVV